MSENIESSSVEKRDETINSLPEYKVVLEYLRKHEILFNDLCELRQKGWASGEGDNHFKERRNRADNAGPKERESFFRMTLKISDEMDRKTSVFRLKNQSPFILDLCMAPGGFTASILKRFPDAHVDAITLSPKDGGHHVIAEHPNLSITFSDITLYATDFGVDTIPSQHPDANIFNDKRPYSDRSYDLVFCGGAVLRTQARAEYRKERESTRLTLSQLIFGFQRIKPGATMVLLLHRVEAWDTARILCAFDKFANIKLFKPWKAHAIKSSFYMIAQSIQSEHEEAVKAVSEWKSWWYELTFGIQEEMDFRRLCVQTDKKDEAVDLMQTFGTRLIELGRPIWKIQAKALRNSNFIKPSTHP